MALLAIALLASAILVTELNSKALQYSRSAPYSEAQTLSHKVAYRLDYAVSERNSSLKLDFAPDLQKEYNVTVESGQVIVEFNRGSSTFPTLYEGSRLEFNTSESYIVYSEGGEVNVES